MDDEQTNTAMCYLAVGGRRLSVFLSMMELPVKVLEHVLVAFLCVHYFLEKKKKKNIESQKSIRLMCRHKTKTCIQTIFTSKSNSA